MSLQKTNFKFALNGTCYADCPTHITADSVLSSQQPTDHSSVCPDVVTGPHETSTLHAGTIHYRGFIWLPPAGYEDSVCVCTNREAFLLDSIKLSYIKSTSGSIPKLSL
jgi:hypothetical protein